MAFWRLSIGMECLTVEKASRGRDPTRCVGDAGSANSGCSVSRRTSSRMRSSYSLSVTAGSSRT